MANDSLWRIKWRRNGEENGVMESLFGEENDEVIALWRNGVALWRKIGEEMANKMAKYYGLNI